MRRRLEEAEEEVHQRASEGQQQQSKDNQMRLAKEEEFKNKELQLKDLMNQRDNETKYEIASLSLEGFKTTDLNGDGIEDPLEREKFQMSLQEKRDNYLIKIKSLENDMLKHKENVELEKESHKIEKMKIRKASK